jgi:hypothetical protein
MKAFQPADILDHRPMQSRRPVELQTDFICVCPAELTSYRLIEAKVAGASM